MAILFNKEADLYIGAIGVQSSIFLLQVQSRLAAGGRAFETRLESDFEDALNDGVQAVIIKDEDLLQSVTAVKYSDGTEAVFPEKDVEIFVIGELTGKVVVFCDEDDAEDDEIDEEFED